MKVPNEVIPERVVKVKENCVNTGNIFHKIKKSMWIGILQQRDGKERACRLNAIKRAKFKFRVTSISLVRLRAVSA